MFSVVEECGSVEKMKAKARSGSHCHATATLLAANRAAKDGTVGEQLPY